MRVSGACLFGWLCAAARRDAARRADSRYLPLFFSFLSSVSPQLCHSAVPWGPFSNSSALSSLFTDSAVRNGVIVRINGALRAVHRAMASMRRFHAAYIEDSDLEPEQLVLRSAPFGTGPNTQDDAQKKVGFFFWRIGLRVLDEQAPAATTMARATSRLRQGFHSHRARSACMSDAACLPSCVSVRARVSFQGVALLARDVSVRLALELEGIEKQFLQLSADIQQHKSLGAKTYLARGRGGRLQRLLALLPGSYACVSLCLFFVARRWASSTRLSGAILVTARSVPFSSGHVHVQLEAQLGGAQSRSR